MEAITTGRYRRSSCKGRFLFCFYITKVVKCAAQPIANSCVFSSIGIQAKIKRLPSLLVLLSPILEGGLFLLSSAGLARVVGLGSIQRSVCCRLRASGESAGGHVFASLSLVYGGLSVSCQACRGVVFGAIPECSGCETNRLCSFRSSAS